MLLVVSLEMMNAIRLKSAFIETRGVSYKIKLLEVLQVREIYIGILVYILMKENVSLRALAGIGLLDLGPRPASVNATRNNLRQGAAEEDSTASKSLGAIHLHGRDILG